MDTVNVFELPVHPWAARFPMRSSEDLEGMAKSIAANGVRVPVVLGMVVLVEKEPPTLCLIDGRNRLAAARLAGVVPPYVTLNGEDADAFIADANLERRDLTKGQKAMLLAVRCEDEGEERKGGRGKKTEAANMAETAGFSARRVREARQVKQWCPQMVDRVISGELGLDEALAEARRQQQLDQATETRFARLVERDPDLADFVREQRMTLPEAEGAARVRREDEQRELEAVRKTIQGIDDYIGCLKGEQMKKIAQLYFDHPDVIPFGATLPDRIETWIAILDQLQEKVDEEQDDGE